MLTTPGRLVYHDIGLLLRRHQILRGLRFYCAYAIPDSARSNTLLLRSISNPGEAACDEEEARISDFARREQETAIVFLTDKGITRKRGFK